MRFFDEKLRTLGTAACPPYHLAIVIGGTSAEYTLKVAKLASARYLDDLPTEGNALGVGFRDTRDRAARCSSSRRRPASARSSAASTSATTCASSGCRGTGASCPVAIAVSCSADRQALGKITRDGVFLEELERDPARFLPEVTDDDLDGGDVVQIDLNRPMSEIRATLSKYPMKTRLALTGPMVVARDIAHAKIKERLDRGEGMPQYLRDYMVYYAGPAKTPEGYASGSFGPTTAGRMDAYVDLFQSNGGSFVMLAKGNRSKAVTDACKKHGGFYLGSIGGPAARLAKDCITKVEVLEYPELGMEAVWKIEVVDFPAFIVVDDKGQRLLRGRVAACVVVAQALILLAGVRRRRAERPRRPKSDFVAECQRRSATRQAKLDRGGRGRARRSRRRSDEVDRLREGARSFPRLETRSPASARSACPPPTPTSSTACCSTSRRCSTTSRTNPDEVLARRHDGVRRHQPAPRRVRAHRVRVGHRSSGPGSTTRTPSTVAT